MSLDLKQINYIKKNIKDLEESLIKELERFLRNQVKNRYHFRHEALIDFGADVNCIRQDLIPSRYFENFNKNLQTIEGRNLRINYKIFELHVYIKISFLLAKTLKLGVIPENPLLPHLNLFTITKKEIITQDKSCYNSRKLPKYVQEISCKNNTRPKPKNKRRINDLYISTDFYYQSKF